MSRDETTRQKHGRRQTNTGLVPTALRAAAQPHVSQVQRDSVTIEEESNRRE